MRFRTKARQPACWKVYQSFPKAWHITKPRFKRVALPNRSGFHLVRTLRGLMDYATAVKERVPIIISVSTINPRKAAQFSDLGRHRKAIAGDAMANRRTYAKRTERLNASNAKEQDNRLKHERHALYNETLKP